MDGCLSDPEKSVMELHVSWGRGSAQQLKRVLVDSDEANMHLPTCVGEVSERHEVRRASDKKPDVPIAGASTVPAFREGMAGGSVVFGRYRRFA